MHITHKRKLIAAGAFAAALIGGGVSIAAASPTAPATATADAQQSDGETADGQDGGAGSAQEAQDTSYTGGLGAPAEAEQAGGQESAGSGDAEQVTRCSPSRR